MSTKLEGIVTTIRNVREQKRPETEKNLQKIDLLLAALRDTRAKSSAVGVRYPDLAEALQEISFDEAENRLLAARTACETALVRLRRESINIGVAAKAGQGKSQMLQMLTGLGNDQIPTGGGGACTAVRSIVHNCATQKAVVHYLTPTEILEKKVYPSYAPAGSTPFALGLAGKPTSLDEFLTKPLSTVEPADRLPTQGVNNWNDNVIPLQRDLNANPELRQLLGNAPEEIPMNEVRKFLVKDNNEKLHNVVDYVELWTPFEVGLPEGLTVYDLPGLEDPTPGIREDMLESVKNDADVVFFLLKPPTNGERTLWTDADNKATDMLQSVYPVEEVKPKDWIQLILNKDSREGHRNAGSINLLLGRNLDGTPSEIITSKIPRGFKPVVCDCGSKDAVRDMVDANIEALVSQAGYIDDLRIRQSDAAFALAISSIRALLSALRNASSNVIAQESGFNFRLHHKTFMRNLRDPFKKDLAPEFYEEARKILSRHFETMEKQFNELYEANDQADVFPAELPVFSRNRLWDEFGGGHGSDEAVDIAVRNQREAVLKLIRDRLTECCAEMVRRYFECVLETSFRPNPSMNRILPVSDGACEPHAWLERFLDAMQDNGTRAGAYPSIESALESLLGFRLTFEEVILPRIYAIPDFDDFDPERRASGELSDVKWYLREDLHDSRERANALFDWLRQKSEGIISSIASGSELSPLDKISQHIGRTMRANYDAFVFRFIWGDTCDDEWQRFADRNKAIFWKEEFEASVANSQLAKDWSEALTGLAAAL